MSSEGANYNAGKTCKVRVPFKILHVVRVTNGHIVEF